MGMFDEIYVDPKVLQNFNIKCPACGRVPFDQRFQTKDLDSCMDQYYLKLINTGTKLFYLDKPSDKTDPELWHEYTDEEIKEKDEKYQDAINLFPWWKHNKGDGEWTEKAWWPSKRKQRDMGELPHQYLEMAGFCECHEFLIIKCKFTDGYLTTAEILRENNEDSV